MHQNPLAGRRALRLIFRNSKFFVGDERDLGINYQTPAFRQMNDHIGKRPRPILAVVAALNHILMAFAKSRPIEHRL
jgi:hypothetical protein